MTKYVSPQAKENKRLRARARGQRPWTDENRERAQQRRKNSEWRREYDFKRARRRFGLTREEYDQLWIDAEGRCDICWVIVFGTSDTHIDHCHDTNVVRGILCRSCNLKMAVVDNIRWLKKALAYRRRHRSAA